MENIFLGDELVYKQKVLSQNYVKPVVVVDTIVKKILRSSDCSHFIGLKSHIKLANRSLSEAHD